MTEATPTEHEQVVQRYLEAYNEKDLEALEETVTDDVVVHGLIGAEGPIQGIEAYKEWAGQIAAGMPDSELSMEDSFAVDDRVGARWTATGTHTGEMFGIEPTEESVEFTGIALFRMEDGKIAEKQYQQDDLGMLQQLGVIPEEL